MNKPFPKALDELATHVAQKAALHDTPLQESTDALKALTPYYALLLKQKMGGTQDDPELSFTDFKKDLESLKTQEINNGAAPRVPGGRRRN